MDRVAITRSNRGLPCIGAGGGAYSNTYRGRIILDGSGNLKKPIYIRKSGPLACELDQAIVPVEVGDIVVELSGGLPAEPESVSINAMQITDFETEGGYEYAVGRPTSISPDQIPESVFVGLNIYHNRDGSYFVA